MALTKQQAETIADSLLAGAGGASDAARTTMVKAVPFVYRSQASRRLDPRQEWLAYREAASRPFNRHPVFIGVMFVCVAMVLLLYWRGPRPVAAWAFIPVIVFPHVVRMILVRRALARTASA